MKDNVSHLPVYIAYGSGNDQTPYSSLYLLISRRAMTEKNPNLITENILLKRNE